MKRKSSGFTIVELLIVIVIIGILAALVIVAYTGIQNRAHDTKRISDIRQLQKVLELYYADNNTYPLLAASHTAVPLSNLTASLSSYTKTIPSDSQYPYSYVTATNYGYGIRMHYKGSYCKVGVNMHPDWWHISDCSV